MEKVMQERGIDLAFRRPKRIQEVLTDEPPALIIDMDEKTGFDICPGVERQEWKIPSVSEAPVEIMAEIRDKIEKKVRDIIQKF